jgi:hypothetical protein
MRKAKTVREPVAAWSWSNAGLMAGPLFVRHVVLPESNRSPNKKSMAGELYLHYLINGNYEEYDGG